MYKIGDKYEKEFKVLDENVKNFANATFDKNPIHIDDEFASKSIFGQRIAHGMLIAGYISSILGNDYPGIGTIYLNQTLKFLKPVFIDDIINIQLEIKDINEKSWLTISTLVYKDENLVLEGEALVIPPKK